jgi:hypothetical protein
MLRVQKDGDVDAAVEEGAEEGLGPKARRNRAPGERTEDRVVDEAVVGAERQKDARASTVDLAARVRGLLCDQIAGAILQSEGGHGSEWRVAEEELAEARHRNVEPGRRAGRAQLATGPESAGCLPGVTSQRVCERG